MSTGSFAAQIKLVDDNGLQRIVVTEAPPLIDVSPQLYDSIKVHPAVPGSHYRDGIWTIGTPGHGVGLVRYRETGERVAPGDSLLDFSYGYRRFERISTPE